ncbi:MAG TPA: aromatic-ring-hydroxylating dioxygenase subunit beta [Candidatus Binataceae bacterium]|nr:aromatic-ring-hydroxylating dioxygenase subunit beta [Candidatus Binataceae bacterium]
MTPPSEVPVASDLYARIVAWVNREAELLDAGKEREWLETMVSKEIVYQVPLRQTVERAHGTGFSDTTFHLNESYGSLMTRVVRNESGFAWAEDPPSRVRHFVTNIRVSELEGNRLAIKSNLLIFRTRRDQTQPQLLSGERQDVLRNEDGEFRLVGRTILLDLTVIETHNLAIIF